MFFRLQALLDHTVQRIFLDLGPVTNSTHPGLKMTWKWGLDGSSSQSNYKQSFLDPQLDDSSVVMMSIVPLRLVDRANIIVWENPAPGSTRFCRPIKFIFTSETKDFVTRETSQMEQEISELVPTSCGDATVAHELHMTMIDGKVANIIADVPSSATCPICLAKPSEMNNLDLVATKPIREDIYKLGISSLHMKIRCMECILHISYNLDFQRWKAHKEFKGQQEAKRNFTRQEFREQTGLLIDIVKQVLNFLLFLKIICIRKNKSHECLNIFIIIYRDLVPPMMEILLGGFFLTTKRHPKSPGLMKR